MENKVLLREIVPYALLEEMLEGGYVRMQVHPLYPGRLGVLNYSEQAQFGRVWNAATNACRGLVVELAGGALSAGSGVVARGFNKFHNLNTEYAPETMEASLPDEVPLVTAKLDGSLGILYAWDGLPWMATRGSFDSAQARWATARLREHDNWWRLSRPSATPVFEIIYPENRIVVDYDFADIVLLALVDKATGLDLPRAAAEDYARFGGFRLVERFDKSLAECAREDNPNEEGYVLTYSTGVKVKVKFAEYCRLHRILTGMNPKAVWEMLAAGQDSALSALLGDERMPAAFRAWLGGWTARLRRELASAEAEARGVFDRRPEGTRKDHALYFKAAAPHLAPVLFAMLDGRDHRPMILDRIRPKATDAFVPEDGPGG